MSEQKKFSKILVASKSDSILAVIENLPVDQNGYFLTEEQITNVETALTESETALEQATANLATAQEAQQTAEASLATANQNIADRDATIAQLQADVKRLKETPGTIRNAAPPKDNVAHEEAPKDPKAKYRTSFDDEADKYAVKK